MDSTGRRRTSATRNRKRFLGGHLSSPAPARKLGGAPKRRTGGLKVFRETHTSNRAHLCLCRSASGIIIFLLYSIFSLITRTENHPGNWMFFFRSAHVPTNRQGEGWRDGDAALSVLTDFYDELYAATAEQVASGAEKGFDTSRGKITQAINYEHRPYNLTSTYSAEVTERGCSLTVLFLDPRLPVMAPGSPAFFSLESVAAYAPESCVILQTALCEVFDQMKAKDEDGDITEEMARQAIADMLYDRSLPLFRRMIEKGQVRIGFPDHKKYQLLSCRDFSTPSAAFMNVNFWEDEFIEGVDSDLVLLLQDDAVLCHNLNPNLWRDIAYVGGVWPKKSNPLAPAPIEGMCFGMPGRWRSWTSPQRRWKKQQESSDRKAKRIARPPTLLDLKFPPVCEGGSGPVGNGGLSLRSRKWLINAIKTCPHVKMSGIDCDSTPLACKVIDDVNEDFYFATILRGLHAPMPTAYEASLFSTEMLWPEETLAIYGDIPTEEREEFVLSRWGQTEMARYGRMQEEGFTVPIGIHKPWWYKSNDILLGDHISRECQFLKYIFNPDDSRWHEYHEAMPWHGIGT